MGLNHAGYKARLRGIYASMWNAADSNPWDEARFASEMVDACQEYIESGDVQFPIPVTVDPLTHNGGTTAVGKIK